MPGSRPSDRKGHGGRIINGLMTGRSDFRPLRTPFNFGPVTLKVHSDLINVVIRGTAVGRSSISSSVIAIRLTHPLYKMPMRVHCGIYDESRDTLFIHPSEGEVSFQLEYEH